MSLADDLAAINEPNEPQYLPRTEYDGSSGFIQTAPIPADTHPDFDAILTEFGYDPTQVQIVGNPRVSRWQQRARNRETNEHETVWLCAYKFTIGPCGLTVDLPALYAEIARTKPRPLKPKTSQSTVVVCWADIQVGKVDHLGGLDELLDRLESKRAALDAHLRHAQFDHIVVCDVGDIIEGFSNFPAQHRTNALSLMDQVDVAATEFWKTLRLCERHAPVDVLSIPSNHCAWRRDGKNLAGKVTDDWGLHVSKRLERQNEEAGLRLTFHRPDDWQETLQFNVRGHRVGLAHGHQVSNPDQIKNWWAKMTHAGVLDCHVLLTGHFHFASLRPAGKNAEGKSRWHIQAPTLDNGSSWVRNKYGEDGDPALAVFQIDEDGFNVTSFALL